MPNYNDLSRLGGLLNDNFEYELVVKNIDVRHLVKQLGGLTRFTTMLNEHDYDVTVKGVQKWCERNRIGHQALLTAMDIGNAIGVPISIRPSS